MFFLLVKYYIPFSENLTQKILAILLVLSVASALGSDDIYKKMRKVYEEALDRSVQTKVSVKRGANVVILDLAAPEDVAKIKAGETIQLEEGRYTGLGELSKRD